MATLLVYQRVLPFNSRLHRPFLFFCKCPNACLVDDSRRFSVGRQGFGKFYETKGRPKAEKAEKPKTEGPKDGPKDTKTTRHKLLTSGLTSGWQFRKNLFEDFGCNIFWYTANSWIPKRTQRELTLRTSKNIYSEQTPAIFISYYIYNMMTDQDVALPIHM